jgi:hypothetical protein
MKDLAFSSRSRPDFATLTANALLFSIADNRRWKLYDGFPAAKNNLDFQSVIISPKRRAWA